MVQGVSPAAASTGAQRSVPRSYHSQRAAAVAGGRGVPERVFVFSLGLPKPGTAAAHRRYRVKWRLAGHDRTRSFKTRGEAERFRAALLLAVRDGLAFDPATGLPTIWAAGDEGPTWWTWAREWLNLRWLHWSGHSRRSAVENLAIFTEHLVRADAPEAPAGLRAWLRSDGLPPGDEPEGDFAIWLGRWSVPLLAMDPGLLEDALRRATTNRDGTAAAASVARRRRNQVSTVLKSAVRRGVIPASPMERLEWRTPSRSLELDISTVPTPADVAAIADDVAAQPGEARRLAALFALVGLAGLRPSEAAGLRVADLSLPAEGWGLATLRGAMTAPGGRFTTDGESVEQKGLKHRAQGSVREVPLPPDLVTRLQAHLRAFPAVDGRVFSNAAGRPVTAANYSPAWIRARRRHWPEDHPLRTARLYDLRHAAATMMLRAGVPPAEVALRLGHSVDVLMRVYAGVFPGDRERSNELIEKALARLD
jgi:integrase